MTSDADRYQCPARRRDRRSELAGRSIEQLEAAALRGPLLINDVAYAELAVRYERIDRLAAFLLSEADIEIAAMPSAGLFLAGKVFQK